MKPFLYKFFHNETNDQSEKGLVHISSDHTKWPKAWKEVQYKERTLYQVIPLAEVDGDFKDLARKRVTTPGAGEVPISLDSLAYILECGMGVRNQTDKKRFSPSGGGRYPLEAYIILFRAVDGLLPGIYHYLIQTHELEIVRIRSFAEEEITNFSSYKWLSSAQGIICLSAVFERSVQKYGSRAYRYILQEAGHVGQNMLLASTEQHVSLIPIGGFNEVLVEELIGLGSSAEKIVYALYIQ